MPLRVGPYNLFFGKGQETEDLAKPLIERLSMLDAVPSERDIFVGEAIYRLGPRIASGLDEMAACLDSR
jgi:hypothetical protein